jgi:hypothetical protein
VSTVILPKAKAPPPIFRWLFWIILGALRLRIFTALALATRKAAANGHGYFDVPKPLKMKILPGVLERSATGTWRHWAPFIAECDGDNDASETATVLILCHMSRLLQVSRQGAWHAVPSEAECDFFDIGGGGGVDIFSWVRVRLHCPTAVHV